MNTVVIGGSAAGCGYALEAAEEVLVLEPSINLCGDFAETFRCAPFTVAGPLSPWGETLVNDLRGRNLLTEDGSVSIQPTAALLAKYMIKRDIPVMLQCKAVSITHVGGKYRVEIFNTEGFGQLECDRIIDTGAYCKISGIYARPVKKWLRAMLSPGTQNAPVDGLMKGRFENEYVLSVELPLSADWLEARGMLMKNLRGWDVAVIASRFDWEYEQPVTETPAPNYIWMPSCSFANMLEAFEGGIRCAAAK
jgi:hypothetical protein